MTIPRPQRLTHHAPPGSLLKRFEAPAPRPRAIEAERDPDYLAMIRTLPCLYCGMEPCGEAAHVRMASAAFRKASGMNKTPPDKWALSLCGPDHRVLKTAQHNHGEAQFWYRLGISPLFVCERLYAQRGDMVAMRAVIFSAIAERGKA
jgi:hypothetical protein